ncbi:hypothetical protein GM661_18135 [Iocasia frigidifontis]|uniref:PglD N-terminal domain-containing protein n=1 Tax=Iocasia fonsfrigidae TaxID=2682810 RepID=A0A8A7KD82_9FIRM|nr:NeuD/PglB/VioB family sugar acetyltransferase [Iocasia fonsfrigidae]QTL99736.1 hypothetical protein GM661_18135 [Iocasia fonsfrigidae]
MKKLFIYGAGGLGRDVFQIVSTKTDIEVLGFIDDFKAGNKISGIKIFNYDAVKNDYNDCFIVLAFGDPILKHKIHQKIKKDNVNYISIISKQCFVSEDARMGKGCIIYPGTIIASNVCLGDNVVISGNTSIGHDVVVSDMSFIGFNCSIGGNTKIGKNNFIGSGSHIKDELKIGDNNIIGLNSKVLKSLSSDKIYYSEVKKIVKKNNKTGVF